MFGGMEANLEDHRLVDVLDLLLVLLQVAGHIYTLSLALVSGQREEIRLYCG